MRRRWTSRLSPCPRSLLTGSQNAVRVLVRAGQTGWWKCLRSLSYSSLQQRTSEQIIDISSSSGSWWMGLVMAAFKVSPRDRVQQRSVEQITLKFQSLMVVVFKVSSQDRVQRLRPLLRTCVLVPWMSRLGFSHFSTDEKKCAVGSALGVGTGCGL